MRALLRKSIALVPWRWRGLIRRLPLVAAAQRWLLSRFLEGREFVHTVDAGPARGLRYPITLPQDKGIWTGTYETELATRIAQATSRGAVGLDIGGWRGFFSGVMALAGAAKVVVFEPLPANARQIRRMQALNPELPIELVEAAVGAEAGQVEFVVMPESSMGKLTASTFQSEQLTGERIPVQVIAIDAWLATQSLAPPKLLKIDVEGAEAMVLRGARRLLAEHKPKLFIEIHTNALALECRHLLEGAGYRVRVLEELLVPAPARHGEVCHFLAE